MGREREGGYTTSSREKGGHGEVVFAPVVCSGAVMPALVHLVVTSVKCYDQLKGRDGRMRKDTRQEANYNNPSGL